MEHTPNVHETTGHSARRFGRSPFDAVDLDPSQRPGVPAERRPEPWPNSRFPPEPMRTRSAVPMHGRPNKKMPPLYGTSVPLHGVSGAIRRAAYSYPDHVATHWLLLLLGDRVESWGTRATRFAKVAAPLALVGAIAARLYRRG